ncbi:MAG: 50S rRNA methyltransferase [Anaerolineae bacterium]|nr:50S rRNA methyltransferase [Anaerolineae bacterium]
MPTPSLILTANPHFIDLAWAELARVQPSAQPAAVLADGVWAVTAVNFFTLAEQWRQQPPIFARHICPVHLVLPVAGLAADVPLLAEVVGADMAAWLDAELPFSVQTRLLADMPYKPFDVNTAVAHTLQQQSPAPLDVRQPGQILSIVVTAEAAYAGISLAVHNVSDWAGGMHRFARQPAQISRAEFKLLEALAVFHMDLPAGGVALDLGAAPGGWTRILRQKGQFVTAVDPAALHPSLSPDKNVRHLRLTAETYLQQPPDRFDVIVNDMRLDARYSAELMAAYAPYLHRHGCALMTLKLPEGDGPGGSRQAIIEQSRVILNLAYTIAGARQLFHNRSEITLYLKKPFTPP